MVDLSGGQDGPIEHRFSNFVFIVSGVIIVSLSVCKQIARVEPLVFRRYEMDDLLRGVRDMVDAEGPAADEAATKIPKDDLPDDFQMPSFEKLMEMIEHLNMSETQKDELKKGLSAQELLAAAATGGRRGIPTVGSGYFESVRIYIFVACVVTMTLIFVFFGYKLYRSLTEKERKREEKRKQKQQKKKQK